MPALGNERDARAGDVLRAARAAAVRRAGSRPPASGTAPMIACSVVDLPAPFGPIRPTISPRSSLQVEPAHRRDAAVAHVDPRSSSTASVIDRLDARRPAPRYAVATSKLRRISSGVPSASVRPRSSTCTRSQTSMISAHVVVDQEHARSEVVADGADDGGEGGDLGLVQPGRRLVHQHEPRLERERPRDAEPALVAVREHRRRLVGARRQAEQPEQPVGAPSRLGRGGAALRAPRPRRSRAPSGRGRAVRAGTSGRARRGRAGAAASA